MVQSAAKPGTATNAIAMPIVTEDAYGNWVPGIVPEPANPGDSIIGGGGGGGGSGQIMEYEVSPVTENLEPDDLDAPAIAVQKDGLGATINWNTTSHTWNV